MKKFIVGLLIGALMLIGSAFAGPTEKKFYEEKYHKAVYDIVTDHKHEHPYGSEIISMYGQGFAVGPHHIVTCAHVVSAQEFVPNHAVPVKDSVVDIFVITKKCIRAPAEIVAIGKGDEPEDDWAILKTVVELKYWMASHIAKVENGDEVINVSGNWTLWGACFPMTIVAEKCAYFAPTFEGKRIKKIKEESLDMYMATPRGRSGDSGSPVFNVQGQLIGLVHGGNERITMLVKASKFKREYNRVKGK